MLVVTVTDEILVWEIDSLEPLAPHSSPTLFTVIITLYNILFLEIDLYFVSHSPLDESLCPEINL